MKHVGLPTNIDNYMIIISFIIKVACNNCQKDLMTPPLRNRRSKSNN